MNASVGMSFKAYSHVIEYQNIAVTFTQGTDYVIIRKYGAERRMPKTATLVQATLQGREQLLAYLESKRKKHTMRPPPIVIPFGNWQPVIRMRRGPDR